MFSTGPIVLFRQCSLWSKYATLLLSSCMNRRVYTKAYIRRYKCSSHFSVHVSAFQITGISSVVSITGYPLISWTREVLSTSWSGHIQGPCCYDTMHVFASKTTSAESLSNLGIPSKSWRFGKILKTLQQEQTRFSHLIYFLTLKTAVLVQQDLGKGTETGH